MCNDESGEIIMEEELEFNQIHWYSPYGLEYSINGSLPNIFRGIKILDDGKVLLLSETKEFRIECNINNLKPLLRPMSALTKPMRLEGYNGGEEFVPIHELIKIEYPTACKIVPFEANVNLFKVYLDNANGSNDYLLYSVSSNILCLRELQLLSQWHFDFQDLIGQGLAIDKTEHENPTL